MPKLLRVLGIDPGSVITGYGVVDTDGIRSFRVAHGHIKVTGETFPDRLGVIFREISQLVEEWAPEEAAIEQVFVSNNAMSALKLGQARGAAISALVTRGLSVAEYTPRSVKQAVVGTGAADKKQVQVMVKTLLGIDAVVQADAADGLAIALCHAHSRTAVAPARRRSGRSSGWRSLRL